MKQYYLSCTVLSLHLAWSPAFESVQEMAENALNMGKIKKAEEAYSNFLALADDQEIGFAKMQLASLYYKDQEHEKAFETFLEALTQAKTVDSSEFSAQEEEIYHSALKIYLSHAGHQPEETAQKLVNEFEAIYKKNPHFHYLGYILAVSYANLGQYDEFFKRFYLSYVNDPKHFLAYKAKAALFIKLFERAKTDAQRKEHRRLILSYAQEAASLKPEDSSLYRMILAFTGDEFKPIMLSTYLNKIMENNIVLPRIDILYYTEIAIAFEHYDLAQKFLNKAKEWYSYSRVINEAQQYLNEKIAK